MIFKVIQEMYTVKNVILNQELHNPYYVVLYVKEKYKYSNAVHIVYYLKPYMHITTQQYKKEISQFNTIQGNLFVDKKRAQMAADYLNEKYIVPIKLIGQ